jgi:uncharacterized membrane protein
VAAVCLGFLYCVIGYFFPKTQQNWVFGIRTPWTMASRETWSRTHQLGGVLFLTTGAAVIIAGIAGMDGVLWLTGGLALALAAALTGYSWWVAKYSDDTPTSRQ